MASRPRRRAAKPGADPERVSFGEKLQAARLAQGRTQQDVAKAAGMTRQRVGLAETGKGNMTWASIAKLAKALGVPVSDLMIDLKSK